MQGEELLLFYKQKYQESVAKNKDLKKKMLLLKQKLTIANSSLEFVKENVVDKKQHELKFSETVYQQFPFDVMDISNADSLAALLS